MNTVRRHTISPERLACWLVPEADLVRKLTVRQKEEREFREALVRQHFELAAERQAIHAAIVVQSVKALVMLRAAGLF